MKVWTPVSAVLQASVQAHLECMSTAVQLPQQHTKGVHVTLAGQLATQHNLCKVK